MLGLKRDTCFSRPDVKSLRALILGERLASDQEQNEQVGPFAGIPVFGLDALSSAAYGPEAALTVLLPLGPLASRYLVPISAAIIALLVIVYASYRQTIEAYPMGGGSYTVAKANLGTKAGLVAASALMLDYMLNVAVAISAGVGALVSAVPTLLPYTLPLCLAILVLLVLVNLRGPRSAGLAFSTPTYAFLVCLFTVMIIGAWRAIVHHGRPVPVVAPPTATGALGVAGWWLLLRSFANGCTAMTGIEAVSNGVPAFRQPRTRNARRTLGMIVTALVGLLAGVALLARAYSIAATEPGKPGYESVLSQLAAAVVGRGVFYDVTIASIVAVLALSANTSFADFPRLCRILAVDGFLPAPFEHRGRRLAFSYGILVLAALAGVLLVVFAGITEGLIPLFAVGALLAFTMSQAGMVVHWRKEAGAKKLAPLAFNALGAIATAVTLALVFLSKFREGAWISAILVLGTLSVFVAVGRHRKRIDALTLTRDPLTLDLEKPIAVVPLRRWDRGSRAALHFAYDLSDEVYALQVRTGDQPVDDLASTWRELAEAPVEAAGKKPPRLVVFQSRYRRAFRPIVGFVQHVAEAHPERHIAVVVPEIVGTRFLRHDLTSVLVRWLLKRRGVEGIAIVSAPSYLDGRRG